MRLVTGSIETHIVGSRCEFEFEVEDDATDDEIEDMAREAAFNCIEWTYNVQDKQS